MLLALLACTPDPTLRLHADPARTGQDGQDGPYGALQISTRVATRVTDTLTVDLIVPTDETDQPTNGPWPTLVLVQGGLVEADRYLWMADHWASRGYATLVPDFPLDLAFFAPDNAVAALREVRQHPPDEAPQFAEVTPTAIVGHSLGGVVAVKAWIAEPTLFSALGLWASYPAPGDDVSQEDGRTILSLVGSDDGKTSDADARSGAERFGNPHYFGIIDGMNHYSWCDDTTEKELEGDKVASRPVEDTRSDAQSVIDTWLDATLTDNLDAQTRLDAG